MPIKAFFKASAGISKIFYRAPTGLKVVRAQSECHILLFFIRCKRCLLPQLSYLLLLRRISSLTAFSVPYFSISLPHSLFFAQLGKIINPGFYDPNSRFPLCGILNRESLEIIILIKNFLDQLI
jgi:hypothetical protein